MRFIKKFYLFVYASLYLPFFFFKRWFLWEYFAYIWSKNSWNHALQITYDLCVKCLYPWFKGILFFAYLIVEGLYRMAPIRPFLSCITTIIFAFFRYCWIELTLIFGNYAQHSEKYQYSFFAYICIWVVVGFALRLLFM